MNYPNPCESYTTANSCYHSCDKWKIRYLHRQKQINAYILHAYRMKKTNTKFRYEHPDIIRRYLEKGPCEKCQRAEVCEPCAAYWRWWDARMEWHRRRLGYDS